MSHYKLRVTAEELPNAFVNDLAQKYGMTLCVREVGSETEKPHFHMLLTTKKSRNALTTFIRKSYKGNEQYSLGVCKEVNGYINYLCKGENGEMPNVTYNSGHDIQSHYEQYKVHLAANEEYLRKRRVASKGTTREVYEKIKDKIGYSTYRSVIGGAILEYYISVEKDFPSKWKINSMVDTIIGLQNEASQEPEKLSYPQLFDVLFGT